MVGGTRRRKSPLGSYVNKPLSRNLSRKNSSIQCNTIEGGIDNREGEAKFLRCSSYYEGAFSIMVPAGFSSIILYSQIEFRARI